MLVQYTPLSQLNEGELSALKSVVRGADLHGSHFVFMGKTLSMSEVRALKASLESFSRAPAQQLNG